jgi:hypothetical protein
MALNTLSAPNNQSLFCKELTVGQLNVEELEYAVLKKSLFTISTPLVFTQNNIYQPIIQLSSIVRSKLNRSVLLNLICSA